MIKIFIFIGFFSSLVFAESNLQKLAFLNNEYAKRFSSGKYISNPEQIISFNKLQDNFRNEMFSNGSLKRILVFRNDYETDLMITLFALSKEDGSLLAIYREKSKYYDDEERSFLRFTGLNSLSDGIQFIRLNKGYAIQLKGYYFKPQTGGTLRIQYLTNMNQNTFSSLDLFLQKNTGAWGFSTVDKKIIKEMFVKTWKNIFPPNGGVKELVLN